MLFVRFSRQALTKSDPKDFQELKNSESVVQTEFNRYAYQQFFVLCFSYKKCLNA